MAALLVAAAAFVTRRLLSPAHNKHTRLDPPTPARRNILDDLQSDGSVASVSERDGSDNNHGKKNDHIGTDGTNGTNQDGGTDVGGDGGRSGGGGANDRYDDSSKGVNAEPFDPESLDEAKET